MSDTVRCSTCGRTLPLGGTAAGEAAGLYHWKRHLTQGDCLRHLAAKVLAATEYLGEDGLLSGGGRLAARADMALRILTDRAPPIRPL